MNNFIERLFADQYRTLLFSKGFSEGAIFGFECNDGWANLIEATLRLTQQHAEPKALNVKVTQAKEKFGQLRIYHSESDKVIDSVFEIAQLASSSICELCGKPGEVVSHEGWLVARCGNHSGKGHLDRIEAHIVDQKYITSYTQAVDAILSFFGEGAVVWVQQERTAFAGRRPCELLATEEGCQAIYLMLKRLEYGVGV
ncbi:MbcA/ParS/Xre antitoxin family protein [Pseudomonas rustica]|uniref:MbcA/ParS/Xre antitoxin family protein n=1 Tax=Pseudomonas rustica TaxID=2827099 RepID=UPI003CF2836C